MRRMSRSKILSEAPPESDEATADEAAAIRLGRAEYERGETMRLTDLQRELGLKSDGFGST